MTFDSKGKVKMLKISLYGLESQHFEKVDFEIIQKKKHSKFPSMQCVKVLL